MSIFKFIALALVLTLANLLYAAVAGGDYRRAIERSWFQLWALFCAWLMVGAPR